MMHFRNTDLIDVIILVVRVAFGDPRRCSLANSATVHQSRAGARRGSLIWVNAACGRTRKNNSARRGIEQTPLGVEWATRATAARTRVAYIRVVPSPAPPLYRLKRDDIVPPRFAPGRKMCQNLPRPADGS